MSAFRDALREMLERGLACPSCDAENIPGKPPDIRIEEGTTDRAGCTHCGKYGPITIFQRRRPDVPVAR